MVGLPGTRVIPKGWEAHHRPVAESTMTGRADLFSTGAPAEYGQWDTPTSTALAQDIPVRVQRMKGNDRLDTPGELVDVRQLLVTMPLDRWPRGLTVTDAGPYLVVTGYAPGHAGDPDLVGRRLRVTGAMRGTLVWERDLTCVIDESEAPHDGIS